MSAMSALPSSNRDWLSLLLFPFKVYPVAALVSLLAWQMPFRGQQFYGWIPDQVGWILGGFLISAGVLIVGGFVQLARKQKKAAISSFCFGVASFVVIPLVLAPIFIKA
jgi:hypothetical protein